jgi:hypothetical protein
LAAAPGSDAWLGDGGWSLSLAGHDATHRSWKVKREAEPFFSPEAGKLSQRQKALHYVANLPSLLLLRARAILGPEISTAEVGESEVNLR